MKKVKQWSSFQIFHIDSFYSSEGGGRIKQKHKHFLSFTTKSRGQHCLPNEGAIPPKLTVQCQKVDNVLLTEANATVNMPESRQIPSGEKRL